MNFYEMAEKVDSKESFLRFVQALAEDAEAADAEPGRTSDGKLNLSPRGWVMKKYLATAASWLLAALVFSPATFAGVIIQPVAVSTDMGTSVGSPENVINQSGLLVGYTSGITDFDDYYFSTPGHNSDDNNAIWASGSPFLPGNFDFDLGGVVLIESMIIWNCDNPRAVYGFNLLADDNPAFSSPTVLGSFLVDNDGPGDRMAPHPLPFSPTLASHVRMEITSNNGPDPLDVRMGEIAFEQVPEPQLLALLGLGGLVALWRARRATVSRV